ncbi:galactose-1-epimerase, partial [Vibrio parahaemolyticus]|nr:galactose-1-epimerase [Vibrio parahaemolyticus]
MKAYFQQLDQAMAQTPSFDGQTANLIPLTTANGLTASVMDIGATWVSCPVPGQGDNREVLV